METGQEQAVLQGHTQWVSSVSFSSEGQILASGSGDGTVLLWGHDAVPDSSVPTAVAAAESRAPAVSRLEPNHPNPFNGRTRISYRLAASGWVRLEICNALGQSVRTLVDQVQPVGAYRVVWDARDQQGEAVAAGVYLTRLSYPGGRQTRRLLYLK